VGATSPTGRDATVVLQTFGNSFLALAPTRIDNDVEIDNDSASKLGQIAVDLNSVHEIPVYLRRPVHHQSSGDADLPVSVKLPEKKKKAMMNAMSIVSTGARVQAPNFLDDVETKPIGTLKGFYSTAMGHFIRKTLPISLCHLAIPARIDPAEDAANADANDGNDEDDGDDGDDGGDGNDGESQSNKRRLSSSSTNKRAKWKQEPSGTRAPIKPERASSSSASAIPFKVTEDGVLDLT
jgi:hypothetical protein